MYYILFFCFYFLMYNHVVTVYHCGLQVLHKLVRRRLMYHSYSMQVHGYISSATNSGHGSFTLVHGVGLFPAS